MRQEAPWNSLAGWYVILIVFAVWGLTWVLGHHAGGEAVAFALALSVIAATGVGIVPSARIAYGIRGSHRNAAGNAVRPAGVSSAR
jgi:hypothetical protein